MYIKYFFLIVLCLLFKPLDAQNLLQNTDTRGNHFVTDSIEKEDVPEGIYAWTIDSRFGSVRPANYDTIPHLFPNEAFTEGIRGHYNFTGIVFAMDNFYFLSLLISSFVAPIKSYSRIPNHLLPI